MNYISLPPLTEILTPIIIGAVVVGGLLGIVGWVGVAIWSKIISIELKRNENKNPELE
jgi:hypothetical protein